MHPDEDVDVGDVRVERVELPQFEICFGEKDVDLRVRPCPLRVETGWREASVLILLSECARFEVFEDHVDQNKDSLVLI